jgi:hypothetical protein
LFLPIFLPSRLSTFYIINARASPENGPGSDFITHDPLAAWLFRNIVCNHTAFVRKFFGNAPYILRTSAVPSSGFLRGFFGSASVIPEETSKKPRRTLEELSKMVRRRYGTIPKDVRIIPEQMQACCIFYEGHFRTKYILDFCHHDIFFQGSKIVSPAH